MNCDDYELCNEVDRPTNSKAASNSIVIAVTKGAEFSWTDSEAELVCRIIDEIGKRRNVQMALQNLEEKNGRELNRLYGENRSLGERVAELELRLKSELAEVDGYRRPFSSKLIRQAIGELFLSNETIEKYVRTAFSNDQERAETIGRLKIAGALVCAAVSYLEGQAGL